MKLSGEQVKRTLRQLPVELIPEDHPVVPQLNQMYGDHTFFFDQNGLSIVEPATAALGASSGNGDQTGVVVNLASWTESDPPKLEAHEPELTTTTVALGV